MDINSILPLLAGLKDNGGNSSIESLLPLIAAMNNNGVSDNQGSDNDIMKLLPMLMAMNGAGGKKSDTADTAAGMEQILPLIAAMNGKGAADSRHEDNEIMKLLPMLSMMSGGGNIDKILPIINAMNGGDKSGEAPKAENKTESEGVKDYNFEYYRDIKKGNLK